MEDNGAAFDIVLENPKRKRVITQEPWFNFDYWLNPSVQYNLTSTGSSIEQKCGQSFMANVSNEMLSWKLASSQSSDSIVPMYYISLENMTTKHQSGSCAVSEYKVDLYLNDWFCFSPLLIR